MRPTDSFTSSFISCSGSSVSSSRSGSISETPTDGTTLFSSSLETLSRKPTSFTRPGLTVSIMVPATHRKILLSCQKRDGHIVTNGPATLTFPSEPRPCNCNEQTPPFLLQIASGSDAWRNGQGSAASLGDCKDFAA